MSVDIRGLATGLAAFHVDVTVYVDRDGYSGSRLLPTFYTVGGNAHDANHNARKIISVSEGYRYPDGAVVTRVRITATPADWQTGGDSTVWDSLDVREPADSGLTRYRWAGDADTDTEVHAWDGAHGDSLVMAVTRTRTGRWAIESSDGRVPLAAYRRRFATPMEALTYLTGTWGRVPVLAECRCGDNGQCD